MALVTRLSEVCDYIVLLLEEAKDALGIPDGGIFYGDQERIPTSPCVCVEPDNKTSDLYGSSRMTNVVHTAMLIVYHSEIRAIESNRRDADRLAETICEMLNADATLGGIAIHSLVTKVESGYSTKATTTLRSSRITFEVQSRELLPNNP